MKEKFWNNSKFHIIPKTHNINFAPRDGFSQITSHTLTLQFCVNCVSVRLTRLLVMLTPPPPPPNIAADLQ